jgi:hypothetical protein
LIRERQQREPTINRALILLQQPRLCLCVFEQSVDAIDDQRGLDQLSGGHKGREQPKLLVVWLSELQQSVNGGLLIAIRHAQTDGRELQSMSLRFIVLFLLKELINSIEDRLRERGGCRIHGGLPLRSARSHIRKPDILLTACGTTK